MRGSFDMAVTFGASKEILAVKRNLDRNGEKLSQSFERLSTGLRINRAVDDAAGLAVAQKLRADNKVYGQAIRNINDAISTLSVAESAVSSLSGLVTRLKEISEQSANGVLNLTQRRALQKEADALVNEYNRITQTVTFNRRNLIDGSYNQMNLQSGYGDNAAIVFNLGEDLARQQGTGSLALSSTLSGGSLDQQAVFADVNEDGKLDLVSTSATDAKINVQLGNGDGTFGTLTSFATGLTGSGPLSVADFNGDGNLDVLVMRGGNITNSSLEASIRLGNGDGTFAAQDTFSTRGGAANYDNREIATGDLDNDGDLDFIYTGMTALTGLVYFDVQLNNGNGTFTTGTGLAGGLTFDSSSVTLGDVNNDGILDAAYAYGDTDDVVAIKLGNGDGTFGSVTTYAGGSNPGEGVRLADLNRDGFLDMINANDDGNALVRLGNGDGTFGSSTAYAFNVDELRIGDINGDGYTDLVGGKDGSLLVRLGNGDGTFGAQTTSTGAGAATDQLEMADINNDGAVEAVMVGNNNLYLFSPSTNQVTTMGYINILTAADAAAQLSTLDTVSTRVQRELGQIGAGQSRLETTIRVLHGRHEQGSAAESRVTDIDYAEEVAQMIKFQVLQDAGTALYAQANVIPEVALQLLRQG